jgi:hypothetical protein
MNLRKLLMVSTMDVKSLLSGTMISVSVAESGNSGL